jgi:hypothetical protein
LSWVVVELAAATTHGSGWPIDTSLIIALSKAPPGIILSQTFSSSSSCTDRQTDRQTIMPFISAAASLQRT